MLFSISILEMLICFPTFAAAKGRTHGRGPVPAPKVEAVTTGVEGRMEARRGFASLSLFSVSGFLTLFPATSVCQSYLIRTFAV